MTAELARWLSNPLVVVGLCAIAGGLLLAFLAWAFTGEYEKGGYEERHAATKGREPTFPATTEPEADAAVGRHHHRFAGAPDEGTRRLWPTTNTARSRVVLIGPEGIESGEEEARRTHHAGEDTRVRVDARKGHVEEEGGADRERGEDEGRAVAHGEEGGAHEEEARTLTGWFYVMPTDRFILLDSRGDIVSVMDAERWEEHRGAAALDLLTQGLPMIPEDVPYHVVNRG